MNRKIFVAFKIIVTVVLLVVIYLQLKTNHSNFRAILPLSRLQWVGIFFVLLLAPLNWLLESIKWKTILLTEQKLSVSEAWQAVLSGYTLGLITPAKIGDYLGRASQYKGRSISALIATFHSSLWQNLANLIAGILGLLYLNYYFENFYLKLVLIPSIALLMLLSAFLSYPASVHKWITWCLGYVKKHLKFIPLPDSLTLDLGDYNPLKLLFYSILRYVVYLSQYTLFAICLGINADLLTLISIISAVLLIQSMIPLPFVAGLLSRAQISILVWGLAGVAIEIALAISVGIWLINIVLPAVFGLNYVLRKKSFTNPLIY